MTIKQALDELKRLDFTMQEFLKDNPTWRGQTSVVMEYIGYNYEGKV